jgi:hypothetical protein
MADAKRVFHGVTKPRSVLPPRPIDDHLREIDGFIAARHDFRQDRVTPAIGAGRASRAVHDRRREASGASCPRPSAGCAR